MIVRKTNGIRLGDIAAPRNDGLESSGTARHGTRLGSRVPGAQRKLRQKQNTTSGSESKTIRRFRFHASDPSIGKYTISDWSTWSASPDLILARFVLGYHYPTSISTWASFWHSLCGSSHKTRSHSRAKLHPQQPSPPCQAPSYHLFTTYAKKADAILSDNGTIHVPRCTIHGVVNNPPCGLCHHVSHPCYEKQKLQAL